MAEEKEQPDPNRMEYRMLGNSGLKVSLLSFGFWATYGVKEGLERAIPVLRIARKAGINFFDNAEAYGTDGSAETIMGQAIKKLQEEDSDLWRRSDIVISTKIFWGGKGLNEKGLCAKHVHEGLVKCLARLQLDYVDVVFCHRPDPLTPTLEVVRAFTQQIKEGKAFYWGTSEWSAQRITEAYWVAEKYNLIAPIVEQPQYNMFCRERFEKEYQRLYAPPYNMGSTIWSPLKSGILTGKYNKEVPKDSRMAHKDYSWLKDRFEREKAELVPKVEELMKVAEKLETSVTCLALAWCCKNPNVSTVILGATKEYQLEENLKALAVARKLTDDDMKAIEKILDNKPDMPRDWGRNSVEVSITPWNP